MKDLNKEQTFVGGFTDKFMLYAWDILGLLIAIGMVAGVAFYMVTGKLI